MSFFEKAASLEQPFVVVTFVEGKGHLPQELGAKAIVTESGLFFGTVGGGVVEAQAIEEAKGLLSRGERAPLLLTWNLQRDLGMTCGGEMSFLLEAHHPASWNVVIYGAGHVGQACSRVLATLSCKLTVIDSRREWREKLPAGVRVLDWARPEERVSELPRGAFHVVVTQDHVLDVPILAALSRVEAPYVGVIGSKTKASKVRAELAALGCPAHYIEKIRCPIGLELGGNEPPEIAVSIAAQLLKERG